jgi:hypothetical protein
MKQKLTKKQRDAMAAAELELGRQAVKEARESMRMLEPARLAMDEACRRLADADLFFLVNEWVVDFEGRKPTAEEVEKYADTVRRCYLMPGIEWNWRTRLMRRLRAKGEPLEAIAEILPPELILAEDKACHVVQVDLPPDVWGAWKRYAAAAGMSLETFVEKSMTAQVRNKPAD